MIVVVVKRVVVVVVGGGGGGGGGLLEEFCAFHPPSFPSRQCQSSSVVRAPLPPLLGEMDAFFTKQQKRKIIMPKK